jgi:aminopeptidase
MSSSSAYILPYNPDPQASIQVNVPGVDVNSLWATTPAGESAPKLGTTRTFFNTPPSNVTTLSSLGEKFASKQPDVKRESIRKSIGSAVKDLKAIDGIKELIIDASADPHAAGRTFYHSPLNVDLIIFDKPLRPIWRFTSSL